MKGFIITSILSIILMILLFINWSFVNSVTDTMLEFIQNVSTVPSPENEQILNEIEEYWESKASLMKLSANHKDIDEIENATNNTGNGDSSTETAYKEVKGVIDDIRTAVINGNSIYYISLEEDSKYYSIKASDDEGVVILNKGDKVTISCDEAAEGEIIAADSVK